MKIKYQEWNPHGKTELLVHKANEVIAEYDEAGYTLTLRQLYYQFVARGIVENTERSYKNLVSMMTKARLSGLVSWTAIEDRNRGHHQFWFDENEINPIRQLPNFIRFDQWARQDYYVEVWVEKEALGNVIAKACKPWLVPYMSCKGYLSASEAWRAGERFRKKLLEGKQCVLIHLGDHDPSGIDMTRDNKERMDLFTGLPDYVDVRRIALNMDQVRKYSPPPNPAKETDTRSPKYTRRYGNKSWELDALEPRVMEQLISDEIEQFINFDEWDDVIEKEEEKKTLLRKVYQRWEKILPILNEE